LPSCSCSALAILYKLKLNQQVTTIPTVGFNVETVTYKNVKVRPSASCLRLGRARAVKRRRRRRRRRRGSVAALLPLQPRLVCVGQP
jgi:hypothetical protein